MGASMMGKGNVTFPIASTPYSIAGRRGRQTLKWINYSNYEALKGTAGRPFSSFLLFGFIGLSPGEWCIFFPDPVMSNESPRRIVIRHTSTEVVQVEADRQGRGKIVAYISPADPDKLDVFQVGVSWESLKRLQERADCDIFHWELVDHSLKVRGKSSRWTLSFTNHRTGISCSVALSEDETASLSDVLFCDLDAVDDSSKV
jgi:hypothetical protein